MTENGDGESEHAETTPPLAMRQQEWIDRITRVAEQAAQGDLEARVLHCGQAGEFEPLGNSLNHFLDMADAFLREAGASLEHASQGKFFRRVLLRGMRGSFRDKSQLLNEATERLGANAQSLHKVKELVAESSKIAQGAVTEASQAQTRMKQLDAASQKIGGVTKLISQIAWQTKLLAFNARIEAARAGDAGAGFRVVAQEVKDLAQQAAVAAEDIAREIGTVHAEVARTNQAIETMSRTITEMSEISTNVHQAVIEQDTTRK